MRNCECDIVIKGDSLSVVYSSPLSGRTYNLDYLSQWRAHHSAAPPAMPMPMPMPMHPGHVFNWDVNWNFQHGAKNDNTEATTTTTTAAPTTTAATESTPAGPKNYSGHVQHGKIDVKWSFNHGGSATTSAATTTTSTTENPIKDDELDETIPTDDDDEKNDIDPTSQ